MKLNLTTRDEEKRQLGVNIYASDYDELTEYAKKNGIKLTMLARTILNDFLDGIRK